MATITQNVVGEDGQQNYKDCLWATGQFDAVKESVEKLTLTASASMEDSLKALQAVQALSPLTEDTKERLAAPPSKDRLIEASHSVRKSGRFQARALQVRYLASMVFAEQWDKLAEKISEDSPPSPERQELLKYSAGKKRYPARGVNVSTLLLLRLVDQMDLGSTSSKSKTLEQKKAELYNARGTGRFCSAIYKQFGPGSFYFVTSKTMSS